ncbi:hypothetical protein M885DRAFT_591013 [Pelagophyceae sp. CCMP2097]|nr:hypothetical protein M885DRAFT_591013 [Pelagophyceae sp. CCMP2097]
MLHDLGLPLTGRPPDKRKRLKSHLFPGLAEAQLEIEELTAENAKALSKIQELEAKNKSLEAANATLLKAAREQAEATKKAEFDAMFAAQHAENEAKLAAFKDAADKDAAAAKQKNLKKDVAKAFKHAENKI